MKRRYRLLTACGVAAATVALSCAPASASTPTTPGATASALPVYTGTAQLAPTLTLTGALGGLLDGLISPIVNQDLNPLVGALQGLAENAVVASLLGAAGNFTAGTPSFQTTPAPGAFPSDTLPSPCGTAYGLPCYNATSGITPNLGSLEGMSLNSIWGYTQEVASSADATNPIFGRASMASPRISVLSGISSLANPVLQADSANSKSNCPNDNLTAPSATESASNVKLLNGLVSFGVSDGNIVSLNVGGVAYASVTALPTLTINGVTVQPYGQSAVKTSITLSASSLIGALGLSSSAVTALLNYVTNSSITLSVIAGPNDSVASDSAKAWGLGMSVDLAGSLSFNLLGVAGATVAIPTGLANGNYGNVLDLRLAYTSCTAGSYTTTTQPVPPALV